MDREDTFFANRINFFLVLQSMLLLSYTTVMYSDNDRKFIGILINIFALVITGYFYILFRRTKKYLEYLREELSLADPIYCAIWDNRKYLYPDKEPRTANWLLGIGLPCLFSTIWMVLLIVYINFFPIIFLIIFLLIISIFIMKHKIP